MTKNILLLFLLLLHVQTSNSQNSMNNNILKPINSLNPLLCDIDSGMCEMPESKVSDEKANIVSVEKPIRVLYFTDPICSSCWGIEPQLRKLILEYGEVIKIEYYMGGLLPDWSYNSGGISKPSDVAQHWDEVSKYYEMPIDGDIWLEDPLHSSYPPSIAFKAAQMQDEQKAIHFLRKIREMVFLEKKNITKWEHIGKAAMLSGLDTIKLKFDYENEAKKNFQNDLALAQNLGVRGFPTMFFVYDTNTQIKVYGSKPYKVFEEAILKLNKDVTKNSYSVTFIDLFNKYNTLTSKEYAVLKGISFEEAEKELGLMHQNKLLKKFNTKNGNIWSLK